jgi:hypothetical protein
MGRVMGRGAWGSGARAALENTEKLKSLYSSNTDGEGFHVRWKGLPENDLFGIEFDSAVLFLNSKYRDQITNSKEQENLLKLLFSLLLRKDFRNTPSRSRHRELREINDLLVSIIQ